MGAGRGWGALAGATADASAAERMLATWAGVGTLLSGSGRRNILLQSFTTSWQSFLPSQPESVPITVNAPVMTMRAMSVPQLSLSVSAMRLSVLGSSAWVATRASRTSPKMATTASRPALLLLLVGTSIVTVSVTAVQAGVRLAPKQIVAVVVALVVVVAVKAGRADVAAVCRMVTVRCTITVLKSVSRNVFVSSEVVEGVVDDMMAREKCRSCRYGRRRQGWR